MPVVLKPAPRGASTFDWVLVVFANESQRVIRKVILYNTTDDKFVAEYWEGVPWVG